MWSAAGASFVVTQAARAQRHENQTDGYAGKPGNEREREVARDDDRGAAKQHALGTKEAVSNPRADDSRQVHGTAVRADDTQRHLLVHTEAAVDHGVVQIDRENALHAVEAESLPHLDTKDVCECARLSEESLRGGGWSGGFMRGMHHSRKPALNGNDSCA